MTAEARQDQDQPQDTPPPDADPAAPEVPPPAPTAEAETVQSLRRERDDLLARLQRVSADYLNYQKRVHRDTDSARRFANEDLIKSLLPVLDDTERALAAGRADHGASDPLLLGMQLVHDKALETLGRFGLRPIQAVGKEFDPLLHAAMMQEPTGDRPPGTVLRELLTGYQLHGRTLRPSGVVVAVATESQEGGSAGQQQGPGDRDV